MSTKTNAWRDLILVRSKPGVTLSLFEDVMEGGVVTVVVHRGGMKRDEEEEK